MKLVEKIRK